jgi:transketolase
LKTAIAGDPGFSKEHPEGKNVFFGIREFAMASIQNGILLHGGLLTYVGSFLIFTDYMKAAVRMAALEKLPAIYLFSHDSIAIGEDGPTHEPVEQITGFRAVPNLHLYPPGRRPRDVCRLADGPLESKSTPTILILTRQNLPLLAHSSEQGVEKGAYVIEENSAKQIQLFATGSEVSLCLQTWLRNLNGKGVEAEVVSMPCLDVFEQTRAKPIKASRPLIAQKRSVTASKWGRASAGTNTPITSTPSRSLVAQLRERMSSKRWAGTADTLLATKVLASLQ